jgi:hypothetical protein
VRRALRVNEYLMSIRDMRGIWAQLGLFTGQFNLFMGQSRAFCESLLRTKLPYRLLNCICESMTVWNERLLCAGAASHGCSYRDHLNPKRITQRFADLEGWYGQILECTPNYV